MGVVALQAFAGGDGQMAMAEGKGSGIVATEAERSTARLEK